MSTEIARVDVDGRPVPVILDLAAGRVEMTVADHLALIAIRQQGTRFAAVHTEVPAALRGKGIGDIMARALLDYIRREGLTVLPYCPFVAAYIKRHHDYADLVDPSFV